MKAESTVMPVTPYEIEYDGDTANITFFENVQQKKAEEGEAAKWEYDVYRLEVRNRESLISNLDSNIEAWILAAKDVEYADLACSIREKRDQMLNDSDWTQMTDVTLTAEEKEKWRIYRQALRDVPQQEWFPYEVTWPRYDG